MKRISWKSINSWVCFALLLAPGLYLFGGYIGQLAGSHGEFMYAEPAIKGGIDYSVEYSNETYKRYGYVPYKISNVEGGSYLLGLNSTGVRLAVSSEESPTIIGTFNDNDNEYFNLNFWEANFGPDDLNSFENCCASFYVTNNNTGFYYYELFYNASSEAGFYFKYTYDNANNAWNSPTSADYWSLSSNDCHIVSGQPIVMQQNNIPNRHIPETQPRIESAPAIEQNAQGNTEFQQGQFFSRNNFLKKWGESVVSEDETWGFAPFKALIQYLDGNMLHFASNGVQYGLMAYGYMYYALHIVLLDLVFYITSFLPRILKKLAERLEGGLE